MFDAFNPEWRCLAAKSPVSKGSRLSMTAVALTPGLPVSHL